MDFRSNAIAQPTHTISAWQWAISVIPLPLQKNVALSGAAERALLPCARAALASTAAAGQLWPGLSGISGAAKPEGW
jgi:hypothetical protein